MVWEPDAAGIDIGAEEIYVAVPPDRDEESTRQFSSFTGDLHALGDWLSRCRIQSVAMESTGVYWIPLFQILEQRGFKVYLVNAHYLKSVPGRQSHVSNCQWWIPVSALGWVAAGELPATPGDLRYWYPVAAPRQPAGDGSRSTFCPGRRRSARGTCSSIMCSATSPGPVAQPFSMPSSRACAIPSNGRDSVIVG